MLVEMPRTFFDLKERLIGTAKTNYYFMTFGAVITIGNQIIWVLFIAVYIVWNEGKYGVYAGL